MSWLACSKEKLPSIGSKRTAHILREKEPDIPIKYVDNYPIAAYKFQLFLDDTFIVSKNIKLKDSRIIAEHEYLHKKTLDFMLSKLKDSMFMEAIAYSDIDLNNWYYSNLSKKDSVLAKYIYKEIK